MSKDNPIDLDALATPSSDVEHELGYMDSSVGGRGKQKVEELLLLVYVHGFKGTDVTFEQFPDRIQALLSASLPTFEVRSEVFPVYETKGELSAATSRFLDWLTNLTIHSESEFQPKLDSTSNGGREKKKARIVLCGHSMGGLLIADALLSLRSSLPSNSPPSSSPPSSSSSSTPGPTSSMAMEEDVDEDGDVKVKVEVEREVVMWPRIVAVLGFDTPYLGLEPGVFKNGITKYSSQIESARSLLSSSGLFSSPTPTPAPTSPTTTTSTPTSFFSRSTLLKTATAAALTAGAAATAYYRKDTIVGGWTWVSDHAVFVRALWDEGGMRRRLVGVEGEGEVGGLAGMVGDQEREERAGRKGLRGGGKGRERIVYRNFYTLIPPKPPTHSRPRTFCILPPRNHPLHPYWHPIQFNPLKTEDEVSAHIGMFNPRTNEAYYEMGLVVVRGVVEAVVGVEEEGRMREEGEERGWGRERGEEEDVIMVDDD